MGYTHYQRNTKPLTPKAKDDLVKVIAHGLKAGILAGPIGEGNPVITDDKINFNGIGDDGCENFYFGEPTDFQFCKTRRAPYDVYCIACLLVLRKHKLATVSSDGNPPDWEAGAALYQEIFGGKKPSLKFLE